MIASRFSGPAAAIAAFAFLVSPTSSRAYDGGILVVSAADGRMPSRPQQTDSLGDLPPPPVGPGTLAGPAHPGQSAASRPDPLTAFCFKISISSLNTKRRVNALKR